MIIMKTLLTTRTLFVLIGIVVLLQGTAFVVVVHAFAPLQVPPHQVQQQQHSLATTTTSPATTARTTTRLYYSQTDYTHTLQALRSSLQSAHESLKQLELLTARLLDMEEHAPHMGALHNSQPALQQAVRAAKTAMDCHGAASPQAKQAFQAIDELMKQQQQQEQQDTTTGTAATTSKELVKPHDERYTETALQHHHAYDKIIDSDLLQQTMQAVERIMAFEHLIQIEHQRVTLQQQKQDQQQHPEDSTPGMPWAPAVTPQ